MNYKVSIIIPFQRESDYLFETVSHINKLKWENLEVILLPDQDLSKEYIESLKSHFPLKIYITGAVSPAIKRDIGAEHSIGDILAFIDDDAYPDPDWLHNALIHFQKEDVCAVGGPQMTPQSDSFWQKVSGALFLSLLNGKAVDRYWPSQNSYEVDDWPSVNLLVRRDIFLAIGGFDSQYWPGEDTKLCFDLIKTGQKIIYEPKAIVFHHRRSGFLRHMRQVGNYGLHRGYFAKKYPETSFKLVYMIPSLFFLFIVCGWMMLLINNYFSYFYGLLCILYVFAILISTVSIYQKVRSASIALSAIPYTIGTHFWYGAKFLKGFFSNNIKQSLGR